MKSIILILAFAVSACAQNLGFRPSMADSPAISVTADNSWNTIVVFPSTADAQIVSLTVNSAPQGCAFRPLAGPFVFGLGVIRYLIVQCGPDSKPGYYSLQFTATDSRGVLRQGLYTLVVSDQH